MDVAELRNEGRVRRLMGAAVGIATLLVSVLVASPARAGQMIVVDDDGQQCAEAAYATIGDALAAATDGDTIEVCAGIYAERLNVTKSVVIIGPVDAVTNFDCFGAAPAQAGDFDATQFAILEPPPPATAEAADPILLLDADRVEVAGLVIQGVVDQTPAPGNIFVPAAASSDAHSGYQVHHNIFRSNTLGMEFGSNGVFSSLVDHNCFRENRWGVANQRFALANAELSSNSSFRIASIAFEVGWAFRGARDVTVSENTVREAAYGILVENSASVLVADNHVESVGVRGIWVSSGNDGVRVADNVIAGGAALTGNPAGIALTGPAAGLVRSTDVVVQDNTVSGMRIVTQTGAVFGYGIVLTANALDGGLIADNVTFGNGQGGLTLFNNNLNNVVRDNISYDNVWYGIRVQLNLSVGNVFRDNEMSGNGVADASDTSDPDMADGIQLRNSWIDNDCVTDEPAGAICGID